MIWPLRIAALLLLLLLSACDIGSKEIEQSRKAHERALWANGVFWGAQAVRSGAQPGEELVRAYQLREKADRRVKEDDAAIQKILEGKSEK